MTRFWKILGALGLVVVLLLGVILFSFYRLIQVGELRRFVIEEVERQTQLKVKVGEVELTMGWVAGVSFRDFALAEPDAPRPVVTAKTVVARVAVWPLLQRRIIFNEVRFYEPAVHVVRDDAGKIPFLDFVLHLLFEKQKEVPFNLDIREVKIEKGELTFLDHRHEQGPATTHLREFTMNLLRVQPGRLSGLLSQGPVPPAPRDEDGPRLEFGLRTALERDGKRAKFAAKGKVQFASDAFELKQALVDADAHLEGLPADLLLRDYGHLLPVKAAQGTLGLHLRYQGSLAGRLQIRGRMEFKRLGIDAPALFADVLAPGDGRVELEMERTAREVRFSRLDLFSREVTLAAQGTVRSWEKEDPDLELRLATPFLPLQAVRKYLPVSSLQSPTVEYVVDILDRGQLRLSSAGFNGRLSELRRVFNAGFGDRVWFDAELREVGGDPAVDRYLPLRGVSGRVVLEKGVFYYKGVKGMYGLSRLSELEGSHQGIWTDQSLLELSIRGELELEELRDQLKLAFFPSHVNQLATSLQELGGKSRFVLSVRKESTLPYLFEGQFSLDNARLRMGDLHLTQVTGGLSLSPKQIRAEKITALLSGSPIHLRGSLSQYLSERPTFDLFADSPGVRAGVVARMLLSAGSPQDPGTVRGSVRYQGSLVSAEDRRLSGSLDLVGVHLPVNLLSRPLTEVNGRVRFDGKGIDFQGLRGRALGFGFGFSGQWKHEEAPQMAFTLSSPELDLGLLLSQIDSNSDGWYDRLQAWGKISIDRGRYEGFEFTDLKTDLFLDKRVWRLDNFAARSAGGEIHGSGSFVDAQQGLRFSVEPKVQGVPLKGFLGWFDMGTTEITGKVNLIGNLDSSGKTGAERKRNLNGAFHLEIEDGAVRRLGLLVRLLNLIDLSRWFSLKLPDINQEGIRFRRITGDYKVSKGVYTTQNLLVDSDDLRITGAGRIDGPKGEIDVVVAIRPFPGLDSAINFIPLIGQGIAAIKNSLLVASFRVTGPIDNPVIIPAPLSTLSEFFYGALAIPKSLIGAQGGEKK